ncbi:MAG: DUF421 domain-containing protein, partial [Clostridia bacterium]|nr:DUF421 domain-containing protein [Clostridia bacterium]
IDLNFDKAKKIVSGEPSIVLNKNGIDDTQLKKNNLDVSDLIESLRVEGYFSLDAVEYALYEAEGTFSALPKPNYQKLQNSLPVIIVRDGKFDKKNIILTERTEEYYLDVLEKRGCKTVKDVLVLTVDGDGKAYLQKRGEKFQTFSLGWDQPVW